MRLRILDENDISAISFAEIDEITNMAGIIPYPEPDDPFGSESEPDNPSDDGSNGETETIFPTYQGDVSTEEIDNFFDDDDSNDGVPDGTDISESENVYEGDISLQTIDTYFDDDDTNDGVSDDDSIDEDGIPDNYEGDISDEEIDSILNS